MPRSLAARSWPSANRLTRLGLAIKAGANETASVVSPRGRLLLALVFTVAGNRIAGYDVIADPERLRRLDLAILDNQAR